MPLRGFSGSLHRQLGFPQTLYCRVRLPGRISPNAWSWALTISIFIANSLNRFIRIHVRYYKYSIGYVKQKKQTFSSQPDPPSCGMPGGKSFIPSAPLAAAPPLFFGWLLVLAAFVLRPELIGVTSMVRGMGLGECRVLMPCFIYFIPPALKTNVLTQTWLLTRV